MALTHIPTVVKTLNDFQRSYGDENLNTDGFTSIIKELEDIQNSYKEVAKAVGGNASNATEYLYADDAIRALTTLRNIYKGQHALNVAG